MELVQQGSKLGNQVASPGFDEDSEKTYAWQPEHRCSSTAGSFIHENP